MIKRALWILSGIVVLVIVLACSPPSQQTRYQREHGAQWLSPGAVGALMGATEARLRDALGEPLEMHTNIEDSETFHHFVYCTSLRTFHTDSGAWQYGYWDGEWHPVRGNHCGQPGEDPNSFGASLARGTQFRIMTVNGIVRDISL